MAHQQSFDGFIPDSLNHTERAESTSLTRDRAEDEHPKCGNSRSENYGQST